MGSWALYGLGSESESMPAYVVMPDPHGAQEAGQPMYANGFLPRSTSPRCFRPGRRPILNLELPPGVSMDERKDTVDFIRNLNRANLEAGDAEFSARISAYDLAFKMQTEAPEVFDLSREPKETLDLYGVGVEPTNDYGRRCLMARRLVEKGTRFVCVGLRRRHRQPPVGRAQRHRGEPPADGVADGQADRGTAEGPEARGLLDSTLIVWGGEFGRSPEAEGGKGRDHHNLGFTMWMAGGGIKGGQVVGATDAIGLKAVERPYHFRDIHTTILNQIGLDQERLTYLHLGRHERLTLLKGRVIKEIV
jgi:hypothetical protein